MKLRLRDNKVKIVKAEEITRVVKELCMEANYHLPQDMKDAICACKMEEPFAIAQNILEKIEERKAAASK